MSMLTVLDLYYVLGYMMPRTTWVMVVWCPRFNYRNMFCYKMSHLGLNIVCTTPLVVWRRGVYVLWLCHTGCSEEVDGFKWNSLCGPADRTPREEAGIAERGAPRECPAASVCVHGPVRVAPLVLHGNTTFLCVRFYRFLSTGMSFRRMYLIHFFFTFIIIICITGVMWDDLIIQRGWK